jgi:hypothetical protein
MYNIICEKEAFLFGSYDGKLVFRSFDRNWQLDAVAIAFASRTKDSGSNPSWVYVCKVFRENIVWLLCMYVDCVFTSEIKAFDAKGTLLKVPKR